MHFCYDSQGNLTTFNDPDNGLVATTATGTQTGAASLVSEVHESWLAASFTYDATGSRSNRRGPSPGQAPKEEEG